MRTLLASSLVLGVFILYGVLAEKPSSVLEPLKTFTHPKSGQPRSVFSCPNNCNSHGTCSHHKCECNSGWAGEDCSFELSQLSSNTPTRGSVPDEDGWAYYRYSVSHGHRFKFTLEQDANSGDCDIYVLYNDYPTDYDYDYYDISVDDSFSIIQAKNDTRSGNWFAGVNAWSENCDFTITASLLDACDGSCVHGACVNGECRCQSGWEGESCSYPVRQLTLNSPALSGDVEEDGWSYYRVLPTRGNELITVTVVENSNNQYHDAIDLYMEYGRLPSEESFTFSNSTTNNRTIISVQAFNTTAMYFGVLGWNGGRFEISASSEGGRDECESTTKCSMHGTCRTGGKKCECNSGFTGLDCQIMIGALAIDTPVHGYVNDDDYNLYYFNTSYQDAVVITVNQINTDGDCDVFIKNGTWPNATSYDFFDASTNPEFSITIDDPLYGNWFVAVFGYEACEYDITYKIQDECSSDECVHGTCDYGNCYCDDGWAGTACDIAATELRNNQVVTGSVSAHGWVYYYINMTDEASSIQVRLKETNNRTQGVVWLYLSIWDAPDLMYFDDDDTSTKIHHEVSMNFDYNDYGARPPRFVEVHDVDMILSVGGVLIYIGVYGSPFAPEDGTVPYEVVAWHPDFKK